MPVPSICLARRCAVAAVAALAATAIVADEPLKVNPFDDPFIAITKALPACPEPSPPTFDDPQFRAEAHDRSQRGVSCWMAGRCRLHNAYLYDKEIVPRVAIALTSSGKFKDTSIWALGQRRYVWLKGCVATAEQAAEAERVVGNIDDVDGVQNQLMVGTQGKPPYATR